MTSLTSTRIKSPICEMLGITYPVIQAGMGPFCTTNLAAAVSNAGGLGTVSIPGVTDPELAAKTIVKHVHDVKENTSKNFAVNSPIASVRTSPKEVLDTQDAMIRAIVKAKKEDPELDKRLVLYITSGGNPKNHYQMIKDAGMKHFHVCGSLKHAKFIEQLGLDGVIASGYEMGGHTHLKGNEVHSFVLFPAVAQALKIPVIASGGVCDGRTMAAAFALGAAGVHMGTRFIASLECDFHQNYKQFVVDAQEFSDTVVQSFISPARALKNEGVKYIIEMQEKLERGELSHVEKADILDICLKKGEVDGDIKDGLIAAGQVSSRIDSMPGVQEIINTMVDDAAMIMTNMKNNVA